VQWILDRFARKETIKQFSNYEPASSPDAGDDSSSRGRDSHPGLCPDSTLQAGDGRIVY